jgi:hypothetical protein
MCLLSLTSCRSRVQFPSGARRRTNPTSHEPQHIQLIVSTETSRANPAATTRNSTQDFSLDMAAVDKSAKTIMFSVDSKFISFFRR